MLREAAGKIREAVLAEAIEHATETP